MRHLPISVALVVVLSAAGCSSKPAPPAPSPAPAAAASPSPAVSVDAQAVRACKLVAAITSPDDLMKAGTAKTIAVAAVGSTDTDIQFAGRMLSDRYELATAAVGSDDETSTSVELMTASINLRTACIKAGLDG